MNETQIKQLILHNQHLSNPVCMQQVVKDMCGLQAQFYNHPKVMLKARSNDYHEHLWKENCIKTWTLRGTLHMIHEDDFTLFISLHTSPSWFAQYFSEMESQMLIKEIEEYLSYHESISRKELKELLNAKGYEERVIAYATNGWGGIFMQLAYEGKMVFADITSRNFKYMSNKESLVKIEERLAKKILLKRYFSHYGPASVNDAAYFLKFKKAEIRTLIEELDLESCQLHNKTYFYYPINEKVKRIPTCLFLACFDPLLLGYEKKESLFLPQKYIRGIFNLTGIIFASILYKGTIIGKWKQHDDKLICIMFKTLTDKEKRQISNKGIKYFDKIHEVCFEEELYD